MYYNRKGEPMSQSEWEAAAFYDDGYQRVAETTLPTGKWVSTVWLGVDHLFRAPGKPLIFETLVFPRSGSKVHGDWEDLDCDRYATEEEALAGHAKMVEKWSKR